MGPKRSRLLLVVSVYCVLRRVFELAVLLFGRQEAKEIEILLRHQLVVLCRQVARLTVRCWLGLRRRCREAAGPCSSVGQGRCSSGTVSSSNAVGAMPAGIDGRAGEGCGSWSGAWRAEPDLGLPRIAGELRGLGMQAAPSTVWAILKESGILRAPRRTGPTWSAFLRVNAKSVLACDFFTVSSRSIRSCYGACRALPLPPPPRPWCDRASTPEASTRRRQGPAANRTTRPTRRTHSRIRRRSMAEFPAPTRSWCRSGRGHGEGARSPSRKVVRRRCRALARRV
jgi:hypothetical protein